MPRPHCTACGGSTSTPRNFLLVCTCGGAWHHRCTNPPVEQRALLAMIAATNRGVHAGSVAAWRCAGCVAGREDRGVGASTSGRVEVRRAAERERPRRRDQDRPVALRRPHTPPPAPVWPPVRRKKRKQQSVSDSVETTPEETITVARRPPSHVPRHVHIQTPESPKHASRAVRQPYPHPTSIRRVSPQKPPPAPRQAPPARTRSPPWRAPSPVPFPHPPPHDIIYQTPRVQRPRSPSPAYSPAPVTPPPPAHAAMPPPSIPALPQIDLRRALRRKHSAILRRSAGSRQEEGPHLKRRKTEDGPSNAQVQNKADSRSEDVVVDERHVMSPPSPVIPHEHVLQRSVSPEEDPARATGPTKEPQLEKQDKAPQPQAPTYPDSDPITAIEIDPTEDGATHQPEAPAELEPNPSEGVEPTKEHSILLPEASPEPEPKPLDEPPLREQSPSQPRASAESEPDSEPHLTNEVEATEPTANPPSTVSTEPEREPEPITPKEVEVTEPSVRSDPMLPEGAHVIEDDHDHVDADDEGHDLCKTKKCTRDLECSPDGKSAEITTETLIAENQAAEASAEPESEPISHAVSEMEPTDQDLLPQQKASTEPNRISVPVVSPRAQSLILQNEGSSDPGSNLAEEVEPTKEHATHKISTEPPESLKLALPDLEAISIPEVALEDQSLPTRKQTTESQAPDLEITTPGPADPAPEPTDRSLMHSPPPPEASLPTPRSRSPRERKSDKAPATKAQQPVPSKVRAPVLARWFKEIATGPPRRRGREKVVAKMRGEMEGGAEWSFVAR